MKTKNSDVYLELLDDFLSGRGLDTERYGLNREDILNMVAFYGHILKPETFILITQCLLNDLLSN